MRGVIPGLLWMVYWTVLAAGTPSFFPDWVQASTWAVGGTGTVLLIGWAKHVEVLNTRLTAKDEDIKRLETKNAELKGEIAELKNQLQGKPPLPPQPTPTIISTFECSAPKQETSKAKFSIPKKELSQDELKTKAAHLANSIHEVIEDIVQPKRRPEIIVELDMMTQAKLITTYREKVAREAIEVKAQSKTSGKEGFLPLTAYTNPRTWNDLEKIATDLGKIANS